MQVKGHQAGVARMNAKHAGFPQVMDNAGGKVGVERTACGSFAHVASAATVTLSSKVRTSWRWPKALTWRLMVGWQASVAEDVPGAGALRLGTGATAMWAMPPLRASGSLT